MEQSTALVDIAPRNDEAVAALVDNIGVLLEDAHKRTVESQEDVLKATEDLAIIKNLMEAVAAKKEEYTRPLMQHLDGVRGVFKEISIPLGQADQILRDKVKAYQQEVRARAEEAERIAALEQEAADAKALLTGAIAEAVKPVQVVGPQATTKGEVGDSGQMMIAKHRVIDFALLPDEYKIVNETYLGRIVRAGKTEIPGVEIWKEPTLQVRRKKSTGRV